MLQNNLIDLYKKKYKVYTNIMIAGEIYKTTCKLYPHTSSFDILPKTSFLIFLSKDDGNELESEYRFLYGNVIISIYINPYNKNFYFKRIS